MEPHNASFLSKVFVVAIEAAAPRHPCAVCLEFVDNAHVFSVVTRAAWRQIPVGLVAHAGNDK